MYNRVTASHKMVKHERQTPDATGPKDLELEAIRQEISRLLPLKSQREQILPLVERLIEIASNSTINQEEVEGAIRRFLERVIGVNPQLLTGLEEMELADIAREVTELPKTPQFYLSSAPNK